jgi:hypothetical protein
MKLLTLILSVIPCFIFAQTQTETNTADTIKPSSEELYTFGTGNTNTLKEGWEKFDNELIGRVHYPNDWKIVENFMGTLFMITSPLSEKDDVFAENISLTSQSITASNQTLTLEKFIVNQKKENNNYFEEFEVVEESDSFYLNDPAKVVVFTGNKNDVSFKIKQYFFIKGNFAYIYTYYAEINVFKQFNNIATDIYKSLRL